MADNSENIKNYWKEINEGINKAENSLNEYLELLKRIGSAENFIKKKTQEVEELQERIKNTTGDQLVIEEAALKIAQDELRSAESQLKIDQQINKTLSKRNLMLEGAIKSGKYIFNNLKEQAKLLGRMQEQVLKTEVSMGISMEQSAGFRDNLYDAVTQTYQIGINLQQLATIQDEYSSALGRNVLMNREQLELVGNIAKGTMLSTEATGEMFGNLQQYNISAEKGYSMVEDMLDSAVKMGLNGNQVISNFNKNLALAQTYNFKEGVKGITEMAKMATQFKIEMQSVAGFADKVMDPEGAIEMAARLQVLGGTWSQLGDPFELMYRSRNDMEGLMRDIVSATGSIANFNRETGEIDISPIELQRLREVAEATGISLDELTKSARQMTSMDLKMGEIDLSIDDEYKEVLANLSTFDEKDKEFKINFSEDGKIVTKRLEDVTNQEAKNIAQQTYNIEQAAKRAVSFDETFENLENTIRSMLLPGFEIFSESFKLGVGELFEYSDSMKDNISGFGKTVGKVAGFFARNPIETLIGALAGFTALNAKMWYTRGVILGRGFNKAVKLVPSTSGSSGNKVTDEVGGTTDTHINDDGSTNKKQPKPRKGKWKSRGMKAGKGLGAGLALAALDMLVQGMGGAFDNMSWTDIILKTLDENKGLIIGAIVGSIIPGAGTFVGASIGGILDGVLPTIGNYEQPQNDFVSRPGQKPIPFTSKDTLIGAKEGGPIDKLLNQVTNVENNTVNNSSGSSNMSVTFSPIDIKGTIKLENESNSVNIDLNDSKFIRQITQTIQEELSRNISGGKISVNPAVI